MSRFYDDVITPQQAGTLHGLFVERARRSPDKVAYRYYSSGITPASGEESSLKLRFQQGAWRDLTWREMLTEIGRWQAALAALGLQRGDRVAIMLRNCPQWMMFDQAAMSLGLVVVPLYIVDRPDNIAYIVNDATVKVLLFESGEQWQSLRTVLDQLGDVICFVSIDVLSDSSVARLKSMNEFLAASHGTRQIDGGELASIHRDTTHPDSPGEQPANSAGQQAGECLTLQEGRVVNVTLRDARHDGLASIIYTSGTTGKPKGVMLSHANMLSNAHACLDTFAVHNDDLFLSFLPLSHTFERTLGYYLTVMTGATVAFARSIQLLSEDLLVIRPTLLISVPRIYERIYGAIRSKLEESSPLKRRLFKFAVDTGWARFEHQQGRGPWRTAFLFWPLLHRLVARQILDKLGGRLRVAISGGAALAPEISRVFVGLGLPILQGYGLTETSPVITGNRQENNFPDSVGQPIRGVEVRLDERNVLLVRGPNVMLGYWNNPDATLAIMDADGWLNTGDVVRISPSGHIYITGRVKEIIVMSNGEKVPPVDMEIEILRDPLFEQVIIFGEARPYLVALAVLNAQAWQQFAQEAGVRADMPEALYDSRVEGLVLKRIALNLRGFPGYAHVRRVLLLREPWTLENGLLTPTLKLKRDKVVQQFASQIEQLYERH